MMLPLPEPPRSVCILRLSAIGDACHVVPIVRTLQQAWQASPIADSLRMQILRGGSGRGNIVESVL